MNPYLYVRESRGQYLLDGDEANEDWRERALCAQTDPNSFFPDKGGSTREPKKVCLFCPVRTECLDWALTFERENSHSLHGIWGGLSERERRKLRRPAA